MRDEFIYRYEAEILRFLHNAVPDITTVTYAQDFDIFNAMRQQHKYPMAIYTRESPEWNNSKTIELRDGKKLVHLVPIEQSYTCRILVENQGTAINVLTALRFYWNKNPYILMRWPEDDILKIGMRLESLKIEENRPIEDKKGAVRIVEMKWKSNLFLSEGDDGRINTTLTESIKIYLGVDETINLEKDKKLIKIIK